MTREDAEIYADNMSYEDAVYNALQGRAIPYRKATKAKLYRLLKALEQESSSDMVHVETLHQVMWERDIAIEQLKELGYSLGQKIDPCEDVIRRISEETKNTLNALKALINNYADIAQDEHFKEGLIYANTLVDKLINQSETEGYYDCSNNR